MKDARRLVTVGKAVAIRVRRRRVGSKGSLLGVGKTVAVGVRRKRIGVRHENLEGVGQAVSVGVDAGADAEESGLARRTVRRAGPDDVGVDGHAVEGGKNDVGRNKTGCVVDVRGRGVEPWKRGALDLERDGRVRDGVRGKERPGAREEVGGAVEVEDSFGQNVVRRPEGGEE